MKHKKVLTLLSAGILIISMGACAGNGNPANEVPTPPAPTETTTPDISFNTKSPVQNATQSENTSSEEIPAYIKDMINEFESIDWDSSIDDIKEKYPDFLKETPEDFAIYTFSAQGTDFTKLYDGTASKITITYMIDVDNVSEANNFFDEMNNAFSKRYGEFVTSPLFQLTNNKTILYALKSDYGYILIGRPTEEERFPGRNLTISFESADGNGIGASTFKLIE